MKERDASHEGGERIYREERSQSGRYDDDSTTACCVLREDDAPKKEVTTLDYYCENLSVRASLTLPKELKVFLYTVPNVSPTSRASRTLRGMMNHLSLTNTDKGRESAAGECNVTQ